MKKTSLTSVKIFPAAILSFFLMTGDALPQTLDPTFGVGGQVYTDFPVASSNYSSSGRYVFVQPSGRIVGVGSHLQPGSKGNLPGVAAVGLTAAGDVDPGFSGGKTLEWHGFSSAFLHDSQMLPDGRILRLTSYISLGNGARTAKLVRTTANGVEDSFFADLNIPSDSNLPNLIKFSVANDGKIYVLVRAYGSFNYYMLRLNPEGDHDNSYGTGGAKLLPALSRLPEPKSVARILVLPNGKVVMGGVTGGQGINQTEVFFARIDSDGNTDRSFGRLGIMRHELGRTVVMRDMLIQGDKYVLAGSIKDGDTDMLMVRSTGRGRLDYSFGSGGIVSDDYTPGGTDYAAALGLDEKGRILIGGEADQDVASPSNFLLARYSADGVLIDGTQTTFSDTFDAGASDLIIQPDGKILLIGYARNPNSSINGNVFATARYTPM